VELRLRNGESNIIEKTAAETQLGNINIQLKKLLQEKEEVQLQLQLLLNTETKLIPNETNLKLNPNILLDSNLIISHPQLKIAEQQNQISKAAMRLEKAKLLPDINLGYYTMSMKGTGADNVLYSGSSRFQSAQLGIGVPLFFKAQKAKIAVSKIYQSYTQNYYLLEKQLLQKRYKAAYSLYLTQLETINYFEQKALPNAKLIADAANKQFLNGEINYLDWGVLINQSIAIRSDYINAVKLLNESSIQLNYLSSK
jgi:cobalt-zinc-cadmium resistance protein CzcA